MTQAPQLDPKAIKCIGFIGVGVMGEPMCRHLATKSQLKVLAFDLDESPLKRLAEFGVQSAGMAQISKEADLIFLSLPSGEIVSKVVLAPAGLLEAGSPGQIVVDLSTSPFDTTQTLAAAFVAKGMYFADAPVMRTRAAAEAGTLAVPVGATPELFALLEPYIQMFATDVRHAGKAGSGQVVKILNNMVVYETVLALSEARAIGVRAGVDPETLFAALAAGSADSFALRNQGLKAIVPQEFPERAFPVTYARKDLSYAVALAEQVGVNATGAKNLVACFDQAIAAGHGAKYAPAISLLFEQSKLD
jgi:3-hydroxyisobutyrate dehydrogenase-like beta-hydroxyacid dehydrogenase